MGRVIVYQASDALKRLDIDANTLDEATLKTGHGIYTVFRLFEGRQVVRFSKHLERMRRSADLSYQPYLVSDEWLRDMTRQVVTEAQQAGIVLPRIRLTVPFDAPNTAIIALEPFTPPAAAVYEHGVSVGLVNVHRDDPNVKSSRFIEQRGSLAADQPQAYYEIMLCGDDGSILEGAGSNFYGVLGGELRTADEGMLPGIARSMVLEVAAGVLPVRMSPIHLSDVPHISEAMLSSSTRGIVPIVQIADQSVGDGKPGPIYAALRNLYEALVAQELEPL